MEYPAIRYQVRLPEVRHADNAPYTYDEGYEVTVIDPDPDSGIRKAIALLPKCRFNRFYVADNLNHYVYNLYF